MKPGARPLRLSRSDVRALIRALVAAEDWHSGVQNGDLPPLLFVSLREEQRLRKGQQRLAARAGALRIRLINHLAAGQAPTRRRPRLQA